MVCESKRQYEAGLILCIRLAPLMHKSANISSIQIYRLHHQQTTHQTAPIKSSEMAPPVPSKAGNNRTLRTYLSQINPKIIGGSFGETDWVPMHGDGKSRTKGACRSEMRKCTDGSYAMRVMMGGNSVLQFVYETLPDLTKVGNDMNTAATAK